MTSDENGSYFDLPKSLHLYLPFLLTVVLLNPGILWLCKQCRSRSVGFWRSQLIWICTVWPEANWSGSALFVIQYVNLYQNPESSNLKIWSGCGNLFSRTRVNLKCLYCNRPFTKFLTLMLIWVILTITTLWANSVDDISEKI